MEARGFSASSGARASPPVLLACDQAAKTALRAPGGAEAPPHGHRSRSFIRCRRSLRIRVRLRNTRAAIRG
jgi:hypothetical protein